jgi:hypothetical protein
VEGLRHEGRPHTVALGDLLDDVAEAHDVVRHRQGVGEPQVDLLLPRGRLVVGELHGDTHRLQGGDGVLPELRGGIGDRLVEVPAGVGGHGTPVGTVLLLEEEELDLGVDVAVEPLVRGDVHLTTQYLARVGPAGLPVRHRDVAEHAGGEHSWTRRNCPAAGSGRWTGPDFAIVSDSTTREKPSIEEPSKPMPSAKAPSSSAGATATDLRYPWMSVNQRRTKRMSRSSRVRRTNSC